MVAFNLLLGTVALLAACVEAASTTPGLNYSIGGIIDFGIVKQINVFITVSRWNVVDRDADCC
jgi:hypothetical protein